SMEAFQEALKVFRKDTAPEIFADIQHHLGIIYSEIPDEVKKKALWAGISVSSFNQALEIFTPGQYPYQYAVVCNSYGNALNKFPDSAINDNHAKALEWYRKALDIRSPQEYPLERALTILNFLEGAWLVSHENETTQHALFEEMMQLAREVEKLTGEPDLTGQAADHLLRLEELKSQL
ncbi:MAG: hypothetical protein LRY55_02620, partial [Leadbetterella sp.]|nr:hypothetical protein [Leadbetterella sp.]